MSYPVLVLDQNGFPKDWATHQEAIVYQAKDLVAWSLGEGEHDVTFRGGHNRITGAMSRLTTAPIIAIKGKSNPGRWNKIPALTNPALFARDWHVCAYCGEKFHEDDLSRDHVIPRSRGGQDIWTNVVTACGPCNHRKDDLLLSECGMELIYVPYAPNLAEALILKKRNILACQMEYISSFLPDHSRVLERMKAKIN